MKRIFLSMVVLGVLAAACGDSDDPAPTADAVQAEVPPPAAGELLFASGFSDGTEISEDLLDIVGIDSDTGFSWDDTPAWIESNALYYAVDNDENISQFQETNIVEAPGPDGSTSRVLHLVNKGDDPDKPSTSRTEWSLFGREDGTTFNEGYIRYWTRLQPDLDQVVPDGVEPRLYYLMESKDRAPGATGSGSGHSGFRINIGLSQDTETRELYWVATGEQVQPERVIEWQSRNTTVDVPLGEWFLIEAYQYRHPTDGKVYVAVNGEVVFDLTVRTQHRDQPRPLLFWSPIKLYHDESWWAAGPTEQWYDDIEVWSGLPTDVDTARRIQP